MPGRLNTSAGLGTLVSSKVNQWTLLVGTLPIASPSRPAPPTACRSTASNERSCPHRRPVGVRVAVLLNLSMSVKEALSVFAPFWIQFVAGAVGPESIHDEVRIITAIAYLILGAILVVRGRTRLRPLLRDGILTPYALMQAEDDEPAIVPR